MPSKYEEIPTQLSKELEAEIVTIQFVAKAVCEMLDLDIAKCESATYSHQSLYLAKSLIVYICMRNFKVSHRAFKIYFKAHGAQVSNKLISYAGYIQRKIRSVMAIKGIINNVEELTNSLTGDLEKVKTRSKNPDEITDIVVRITGGKDLAGYIATNSLRRTRPNLFKKEVCNTPEDISRL